APAPPPAAAGQPAAELEPRARELLELMDNPVRLSEYQRRFPYLLNGPDDPEVRRLREQILEADVRPEYKACLRNLPPRDWALDTPFLGRRFLAFLLDLPLFVVFFFIGAAVVVTAAEGKGSDAASLPLLVWIIASYLIYFVGSEWLLGASLGKFLTGLRVVGPYGGRPSLGFCLKRQFTRLFKLAVMALGAWAASQSRTTSGKMAGGQLVGRIGRPGGANGVVRS
ncbi:MAG: RDD family protein, partial [Gemmatimonadota bacterium]